MNKPLRISASTLVLRVVRQPGGPPMIEQLVVQIRRLIEHGDLPALARLPASRALADELSISRTVVTEVYSILTAEGYLETRRGSGTYVVEGLAAEEPPDRSSQQDRLPRWLPREIEPPAVDPRDGEMVSFRICEPDPASFPDKAWLACVRAAWSEPLPVGYAPPEGDEALRQAIASFVSRERGLRCSPNDILVTSGATQALDLIARATLKPGDAVAFEDPGYRLARQIFVERGARIQTLPVLEGGVAVEALDASDPPVLIYTTPSHQFPTGEVLSYRRRQELLNWAACHDALVIEDDYDSEFRFDGPALPALASRDQQGIVAYLGTFSKSLAPSLRIGYLIAPEPLREAVRYLKVRTDYHVSWSLQRALERYLTSGAFARHLRRMRRIYRERRDLLVSALEPLPSNARWLGLAAGLHATLQLPDHHSAEVIAARCAKAGLLVRTLRDYAVNASANGLVLGYGAVADVQLRERVELLRAHL